MACTPSDFFATEKGSHLHAKSLISSQSMPPDRKLEARLSAAALAASAVRVGYMAAACARSERYPHQHIFVPKQSPNTSTSIATAAVRAAAAHASVSSCGEIESSMHEDDAPRRRAQPVAPAKENSDIVSRFDSLGYQITLEASRGQNGEEPLRSRLLEARKIDSETNGACKDGVVAESSKCLQRQQFYGCCPSWMCRLISFSIAQKTHFAIPQVTHVGALLLWLLVALIAIMIFRQPAT